MKKTNWNFEKNLPSGLENSAKEVFQPIWHSAVLNLGKQHNWRNLRNSGWYAGLEIGRANVGDQTWEVHLHEQGGIMQSVEGASR